MSRDELYVSLSHLVPDITFDTWLCWKMQQNVWATREIHMSRICTLIDYQWYYGRDDGIYFRKSIVKQWSIDGKARMDRSWYNNGKIQWEFTMQHGKVHLYRTRTDTGKQLWGAEYDTKSGRLIRPF